MRLILALIALCVILSVQKNGVFAQDDSEAVEAETKEADSGVVMTGFSKENEEALSSNKESFEFQAEVNRLMDIIINSLYKNKEVFLRELISNASDALDKIRFLALTDADSVYGETKDLEIQIEFNEEHKTLTIRDTGVGMTKADLVANLGTVAKSGTTNFVEALSDGADMSLIGQFGVGFYSIYLVADKVRVVSKSNDDDQYIWESTADSSFSVAKDPRGNTIGRGTEITMFLKDDAEEFLQQQKLEELVQRYSEFITFPIKLYKKTMETVEVEEEDDEDDSDSPKVDEDGIEVTEDEDKPDTEVKTEQIETWDWHRINNNMAIWARDQEDITDDEYRKFYKSISATSAPGTDASTWIHFKAEGEVEFKGILFVPNDASSLYDDYSNKKAGLRLYVRKVLIQEDFDDLIPKYLNFIIGVVDSDDLPLNVSRETLQQHKILKVMGKKLVRKTLEMLRKMSQGKSLTAEDDEENSEDDENKLALDDPEHPYIKFWEMFGKSIKMGVIEDTANRSKLAKLLRFKSSTSEGKWVSLEQYIENMQEWQKEIYFLAGENEEAVERSPFLEVANKKKIEVLYLTDPVDEYTFQHMSEFDGNKLQSLSKEGIKFGDEDEDTMKKRAKAYKTSFKGLTKYLKDLYASKVGAVKISSRVDRTPAIIVTSQYGHTANMERIMRAQTFASGENIKTMSAAKTLELNPRHPVVVALKDLIDTDPEAQSTQDLANLLYDTALLSSGFSQEDPEEYADRMHRIIASQLKVDSMDLVKEIEFEDDEESEEDSEDSNDNDSSANFGNGNDEF